MTNQFIGSVNEYEMKDIEDNLRRLVNGTLGFTQFEEIDEFWIHTGSSEMYHDYLKVFSLDNHSKKRQYDEAIFGPSHPEFVPTRFEEFLTGYYPQNQPNNPFTMLSVALCCSTKMSSFIRFLIVGYLLENSAYFQTRMGFFANLSKNQEGPGHYKWHFWDYVLSAAMIDSLGERPNRLAVIRDEDWEKFNNGTLFHLYVATFFIKRPLYLVDADNEISLRYFCSYRVGDIELDVCLFFRYIEDTDENEDIVLLLPRRSFAAIDPAFQYRYIIPLWDEKDRDEWNITLTEPNEVPNHIQMRVRATFRALAIENKGQSSSEKQTSDPQNRPSSSKKQKPDQTSGPSTSKKQNSPPSGDLNVPAPFKHRNAVLNLSWRKQQVYDHCSVLYDEYILENFDARHEERGKSHPVASNDEFFIYRFTDVVLDNYKFGTNKNFFIFYDVEWDTKPDHVITREPASEFDISGCESLFRRFILYFFEHFVLSELKLLTGHIHNPVWHEPIAGGFITKSSGLSTKDMELFEVRFAESDFGTLRDGVLQTFKSSALYHPEDGHRRYVIIIEFSFVVLISIYK